MESALKKGISVIDAARLVIGLHRYYGDHDCPKSGPAYMTTFGGNALLREARDYIGPYNSVPTGVLALKDFISTAGFGGLLGHSVVELEAAMDVHVLPFDVKPEAAILALASDENPTMWASSCPIEPEAVEDSEALADPFDGVTITSVTPPRHPRPVHTFVEQGSLTVSFQLVQFADVILGDDGIPLAPDLAVDAYELSAVIAKHLEASLDEVSKVLNAKFNGSAVVRRLAAAAIGS